MTAASLSPTRTENASAGMVTRLGSTSNGILKLLPPSEMDALNRRTQLVTVESTEILFEPEETLEYVHFPEDCVISLVTMLADGHQVGAMTVGHDDFSGIPVFHGIDTSPNR